MSLKSKAICSTLKKIGCITKRNLNCPDFYTFKTFFNIQKHGYLNLVQSPPNDDINKLLGKDL